MTFGTSGVIDSSETVTADSTPVALTAPLSTANYLLYIYNGSSNTVSLVPNSGAVSGHSALRIDASKATGPWGPFPGDKLPRLYAASSSAGVVVSYYLVRSEA